MTRLGSYPQEVSRVNGSCEERESAPSALSLVSIRKNFGEAVAVDGLSLSVERGELVTLLGPSGCGKTTTLRMIAGFEQPDSGEIWLEGEDLTGARSNERDIGMVFQNYALFPHMSVADNVAFGLEMRKRPGQEIGDRVQRVLDLVQLPDLGHRRPSELSGGQQQRVALARALVIEPRLLLLDEPLSNLDARLRIQMRAEIRRIQRLVGITTIFVTHDQEEALSLSDRIVVMRRGAIVQNGSPAEVYEQPQDVFVARFFGQDNLLEGSVRSGKTGELYLLTAEGVEVRGLRQSQVAPGDPLVVMIKKDRISISQERPADVPNVLEARLEWIDYLGEFTNYGCSAADTSLVVSRRSFNSPQKWLSEGMRVYLSFNKDALVILQGSLSEP
ncbi:MAG: ABC transporter ATP-binding protein [Acidimicrobiia bacterium]